MNHPCDESQTSAEDTCYSVRHRVFRAAWAVTWLVVASWTPAPMHRWRVAWLRIFGATVHPTAHVYGSARIWYPPNLHMGERACLGPDVNCYNMAQVTIGRRATISQGANLCTGTHDVDDPSHPLVTRPIAIGDSAWVASEAFVGPGVTVGEGAVLGARAVLFKDAVALGIYAGNPAILLKHRSRRALGEYYA